METIVKVFKKKKKLYEKIHKRDNWQYFNDLCCEKYHAYLYVYQFIECSVGYSGDNCSVVCPSDSYGKLCSQTCDSHCISCHHIFGCNVTEETTGNTFEIKVFFFIFFHSNVNQIKNVHALKMHYVRSVTFSINKLTTLVVMKITIQTILSNSKKKSQYSFLK